MAMNSGVVEVPPSQTAYRYSELWSYKWVPANVIRWTPLGSTAPNPEFNCFIGFT